MGIGVLCEGSSTATRKNFVMKENGKSVSRLTISVNGNKWAIIAWYTENEFRRKGYGKSLLSYGFTQMSKWFEEPEEITYVWNGVNQYVYNWLLKFDPVSKCPVSVQKNQAEADWASHEYVLSKTKLTRYLGVI